MKAARRFLVIAQLLAISGFLIGFGGYVLTLHASGYREFVNVWGYVLLGSLAAVWIFAAFADRVMQAERGRTNLPSRR